MTRPVKLSDIVVGIEIQCEALNTYLNKQTGEVVSVSADERRAAEDREPVEKFPWWQQECIATAIEVMEKDCFVNLPSQFEVPEWDIAERFCRSQEDDKLSQIICSTSKEDSAFHKFKDHIYRHNKAVHWYQYREEAVKQIAIDWCKENGVEFIDE